MAKLSIVILNYKTKDLTVRAIRSCLDLAFKDLHIYVVDNASGDDSLESFREFARKEPRLTVIGEKENRGFAAGNNVALKLIESEYVMLLNSDAYFPQDADIEIALDFMDQYQDIGVLTPFVRLSNGKIDPACHRGFPNPWNAVCYFAGLEKTNVLKRLFGGYHQTWKNLATIHADQKMEY